MTATTCICNVTDRYFGAHRTDPSGGPIPQAALHLGTGRAGRRRDIVRKTKNGLETARKQGKVGGRRPVVDDDKRAAILARRRRGESIRTIAAGVKVSVGVVHKTLKTAEGNPTDRPGLID
ncbi:hypothetical protein [Sphaerisporangium fuscum]|uniref:hypothetical protein n=1 Tax=Sphaerisporangium fuscum TaxID=2835868 RepID=UPI001BDC170E|nr:hypothetical protein [Sphaerisporangium fuscum]